MDRQDFAAAEAAKAAQELGVPDETPNEPAPQPEQPQAQPEAESPAQPADAPALEETDEEDDIPTFQRQAPLQQQPQQQAQAPIEVKPLDPKDFTNEATGEVDTNAFAQAMQSRDAQLQQAIVQQVAQSLLPQLTQQASQISAQQVTAVKREERGWEQAFKKYPEVQSNKELRDTVHNYRIGVLQTQGQELSPRQAADRVLKFMSVAKQEGQKQATQTVRMQASAHLETADNTASDRGLKQQQTRQHIDSRDRTVATQARESLLKDMLSRGVI